MNAQQFLTWMRSPGQTSREESAQLDALLDAFPYFQSGHLLYIKNLHNQGSFLYNNQLKTAAAYAVNRKVLYQLITLKPAEDERRETGEVEPGRLQSGAVKQSTVGQSAVEMSALDSARSDKQSSVEQSDSKHAESEHISVPPKFPPKKFTSDPDEWEAGMLRQLQLLHHWKKTGESEFRIQNSELKVERAEEPKQEPVEEVNPGAKEEINTLLYVLVEPGQPEDLSTENAEEEITTEEISDEPEGTQWEVTPAAEVQPEVIVKPNDAVQQEILVEAIHSSFELEVDDTIPSVEELKPFRLERIPENTPEPVAEKTEIQEEVVVAGFEQMSFSDWLKEVSKKVPAELPKTPLSGDKLIDQFIKEEPRIQVKKSGFFNPVNMAKKSVQESDEFITETLARIYAKQGNHSKAIRAYQKLSLKFPEKTAYFAALIEELKRTPNK